MMMTMMMIIIINDADDFGDDDNTHCNILLRFINSRGRRGGLVVSMLDSRSRGLGLSPGWVIVLCSWARHFTLTAPLSTQE